MATANGATFDGSAASFESSADLTDNADSKLWTFSLWFKRVGISTAQQIYASSSKNNRVEFLSNNLIHVRAENAAGTAILEIDTSAITDTASWHNLLCSVDLSDTGKRHLYVDDSTDLSVTTYTDDTINFTNANHAIGAAPNNVEWYDGCLSEVWIDHGTYIDFSTESNRRKFISSGLKAVDLGATGNTPTGTAPIMYFANAYTSFETNLGTGGGFGTVNGTLADCTGPEFAAAVPLMRRRREGAYAY